MCLRIPVSSRYEIDLDGIEVIQDERTREKLFFLKYKSADADTFVKYVFGDIYFTQERGDFTGTSPGYYRLGDPDSGHPTFRKGSFDRGADDASGVVSREKKITSAKEGNTVIQALRHELQSAVGGTSYRKIDLIERLLRYQSSVRELLERGETVDTSLLLDEDRLRFVNANRAFAEVKSGRYSKRRFRSVLDEAEPMWEEVKTSEEAVRELSEYASGRIFLHFDIAGEHWYEQESAMQAIDQQFVSKFAESVSKGEHDGAVLKKYIYKTMIPGHQLPEFDPQNQHRVRLFSQDELMDLFYAIDMAKTSKFRSADVKVVVLPRGKNMSAEDVTRFMQGAQSLEEVAEQEREFRGDTIHDEEATVDQVLDAALSDAPEPILEFDLVFSEADSRGQDADLVELSGVSRSFLEKVRQQIKEARDKVQSEYEQKMGRELDSLNVYQAFRGLLSGVGQDQPRYQRHLYRMLPKIYTETYHRDPLLLPSLIEQTEKAVRDSEAPYFEFNRLHHYFRFLVHLQTSNPIMQIRESTGYKLGKPLGVMARPLRSRINVGG